jgi:hypothetical protein
VRALSTVIRERAQQRERIHALFEREARVGVASSAANAPARRRS